MTVSLSTTPSWGSVSSLGVVTLLVLKSFGAAIQHEVLEIRPDLVEVLLLLVHVLQLALGQVHCIPFLQGEGATARCRRGPPGKTQKTPEEAVDGTRRSSSWMLAQQRDRLISSSTIVDIEAFATPQGSPVEEPLAPSFRAEDRVRINPSSQLRSW